MIKLKKLDESKTKLPITYLTNFVSRGWGEVGNLKEELEAIKHEFKDVKKIEECVSDLIDAYLVCIGTLENILNDKKYVEFPEEIKESLTENFELEKAENEVFDFEDTSEEELASTAAETEQETLVNGLSVEQEPAKKSDDFEPFDYFCDFD